MRLHILAVYGILTTDNITAETKMKKNTNMTQGSPLKLLFTFALPLMFGNVFQQLYTVVDTAIVGRGVGMDALAALGTVDWLNWMLLGIAQGFTQGFSVRIAQAFGKGDAEGLKKYIGQSARISAIIAIVCTALAQLCLPLFLLLLRVPDTLAPMATLYTRILMGGLPAVVFYNYCSSVLRAVGDSKTPLKAMIAASVTNIVLDWLAVFVLGLGIAGAAAATVISQCLSGVICAIKIIRTPELHFGKGHLKSDPVLGRDLIKIGSPAAAKNIIISLGGMVVQTVVNGFAMSFIAGFTATNKLYGLLEIAAISYGYAVTTYVGQNYGAARPDRIRLGTRAAVILSLITSVVIAAAMIVFGRPITMLFISSDSLQLMAAAGNTAYSYLCTMSVFLPVLYLLYVYLSAIQGMGNTVVPMISGIIEFSLRVGIAVIIGFTSFRNGIFGAEVAAWAGAALYLAITYYHMQRKLTSQNMSIPK